MGAAPDGAQLWIPALLIVVGLAGIVIPVLPGLLLILAGVLVWALAEQSTTGWVVFAVSLALFGAGVALQYLVPGRRMRAEGVGGGTLALAVLLGVVGLFVIPLVGAPIGFVLGIYLVEHARSRDGRLAWQRTKAALRAVLTSMGIELLAGLFIAATWVLGVLLTR